MVAKRPPLIGVVLSLPQSIMCTFDSAIEVSPDDPRIPFDVREFNERLRFLGFVSRMKQEIDAAEALNAPGRHDAPRQGAHR
jgi:hypothetical protein